MTKIESGDFQFEWEGTRILRSTMIPSKRKVPCHEDVLIPTDLREWITPSDSAEIRAIIRELDVPTTKDKGDFDKRARSMWQYVCENIEYVSDCKSQHKSDFWQFPAETLALKKGDCEDCSFLLTSLLLASGVSPFCVRLVLGSHIDKNSQTNHHSWPVYRDEGGTWRILESTLDSVPSTWPAADDVSMPEMVPRYHPEICLNQQHVWVIGKRRIRSAAAQIKRRSK